MDGLAIPANALAVHVFDEVLAAAGPDEPPVAWTDG